MDSPLRTIIRCVHNGEKMGSVVVVRGEPIYDDNGLVRDYKKKFLQVRRGSVKGKACHAFFDTLDEWHKSMGIPSEETIVHQIDSIYLSLCASVAMLLIAFMASYIQAF